MNKNYQQLRGGWRLLLAALLLWVGIAPAVAQSGPYGNEWIVPGQDYYKVKVARTGLYRLDYQYLQQAGITGVDPSRIQLWRRGREVAVYQGGSANVLDANTYFEFYGQHNNGALDKELYHNSADQPHPYYSFYTDTAAYFITYGAQAGRRMTQPVAVGGTPHTHRLINTVKLENWNYNEPNLLSNTMHLPWLEKGEGYMSTTTTDAPESNDSLYFAMPPTPAPYLTAVVSGGSPGPHLTDIGLKTWGQTPRVIGTISGYSDFNAAKGTFPLQRSDFYSGTDPRYRGKLQMNFAKNPNAIAGDVLIPAYFRLVAPQYNRWFTNKRWLLFQNDSLLGGPATYELDTIPATVRGYDVHDPWNVQRIEPTAATTLGPLARRFVFPSATGQQTRWLLLADVNRALVPPPARRVRFRTINPATPTYIIITHKQLMGPAAGTTNAALSYAQYRASAAGGGYDTLMVTAAQLYDQFHYGERSWLALRHFGLWLAANSTPARPKFLLLLGKGITPNEIVNGAAPNRNYNLTGNTTRALGERGMDLVPVSTRSASDNLLTADYQNDNYAAKLPTGRIAAVTPAEVMAYLNKVMAHEQPGLAAWRKNVLLLGGGTEPADIQEFGNFSNIYKQHVEQPCFVGNAKILNRTIISASNSSFPVSTNIATDLNAGLSVIGYIGHGSNTVFALDIGLPTDNNGYANQNKYPVMFFNGCVAANIFVNFPTFGNSWLFTPDKGSVGLMGQTGYSYAYLLHPMQDSMYVRLFNNPSWYGKPIAQAQNEVVKSLQLQSNYQLASNPPGVEQLLGTLWHGDPALRLYAPTLPDFQTSDAKLAMAPGPGLSQISASAANVTLNIGVTNPGNFCTRNDSLIIRVTRTYGQGSTRPPTVFTDTVALIHQVDAVYSVVLPNTAYNGIGVFGNNRFQVELDYGNRVPELNESNNTAELYYSFLQGGVTLLNPPAFAIVASSTPRLVAQTNDPNSVVERGFEFEVDTTAAFSSTGTWHQQQVVRASLTPSWQPTLPSVPGGDSLVWYWRVRLQSPQGDEDGNWVNSSFRVIPGALGWSQSHYAQFQQDQRTAVDVTTSTGRWNFTNEEKAFALRTRGGGLPGAAATFTLSDGIIADPTAPPYVNNCATAAPNVMLAVYDHATLLPKQVAGASLSCGQGSQAFYMFAANPASAADTLNNINNSAARQAELTALLNNVADGDYVALISMNRVRWASPALASVKATLTSLLGSQLVNRLQNGDAFTLLARKSSTGGRLVRELGPDLNTGAAPRATQIVALADTLRTPSSRGTVTSVRIGPAQQWETLYHWVSKETASSSYTLRLLGIDASGNTTVLNTNVPTATSLSSYSLTAAGISAQTYPYLQLELELKDSVNRVAPQLREWFITYRGVPEGVVRRDLVATALYDPAALAQQALTTGKIKFPVKFENITPVAFGTPLRAKVELLNANGTASKTLYMDAPRALVGNDSTLTLNVSIPMVGVFGTFTPKVTVNPQPAALPELYYFNNELTLAPFTVVDTNLPPTLDVAFDGRRILSGELVSPRPLISIQLSDEDKLRHIRKVSYFSVTLQRPGGVPVAVDLGASNVRFSADSTKGTRATLEYQPGQGTPLADGIYTLRVQGRDPGNAAAGTGAGGASQDLEVKFEVVNASTITNVFPYPNPVTSKARFVFTVTGQELPRNLKIQIMTIAGRVVRELFMSELGPLHIGNNITDYAWDGTDAYGDRLANGTYLYRVSLDDPQAQFGQRSTAGDRAFKQDWGKLVLMR
jgi:hypothetical protein